MMEHEQPSLGAEETEQAASHWYLAQPSHGGRAAPSPSLITRLRARQPTNGAPASGAMSLSKPILRLEPAATTIAESIVIPSD